MLLDDLRQVLHEQGGFACACTIMPVQGEPYQAPVLLRLTSGNTARALLGWAENDDMPHRASAASALILAEDAPQGMNESLTFMVDNGIQRYRVDGAQPLLDVDDASGQLFVAAWRLVLRGAQRGGR